MSSDTARLSVEIPVKVHKKLKILADASGLTLKELILEALKPILYPQKKPNAMTKKALKDTEKGIGLIPCDDIEDLWDKLGLNE